MDSEERITNKVMMKVEIPSSESETTSPTSGQPGGGGGLARQGSAAKSNCLCSPTTHAGSFRCRLHRAPSLQRTKSIDSGGHKDSDQSKANTSCDTTIKRNTVEAQ